MIILNRDKRNNMEGILKTTRFKEVQYELQGDIF